MRGVVAKHLRVQAAKATKGKEYKVYRRFYQRLKREHRILSTST